MGITIYSGSVSRSGLSRFADTWKMVVVALLALASSTKFAQGEDKFSGAHAAYIDWGARNCGVKSTSKQHGLVDEANVKDRDGFLRQYIDKNGSKELSDALTTPARQEAMCGQIKSWYGPSGTRITGLLVWERTSSTEVGKPAAPSKGALKQRKRMKDGGP